MISNKTQPIKLALLPALVGFCMHASALEQLDDASLGQVSGKDGIAITASMDSATIGKATWQDGADSTKGGALVFNTIAISPTTGNSSVSSKITVQTGSTSAGAPGIGVTAGLSPATVSVAQLQVCDSAGANCKKLGGLAVTNNGKETQLSLITANGLFNEKGSAQLKTILDDLSIGLTQTNNGANQLILGNMYANMTADGSLYISETEGLKFVGKVSFDKKTFGSVERQGLELIVQHKAGANTTNLGKLAVTGNINNFNLSLRGVKGTVTGLGFDNGDNGIAMRMKGELDSALKLQLGGASGTGMRMTGWQGFANGSPASFDSGNVYLNVIPSGQTTSIPTNTVLTAVNTATLAAAQAKPHGTTFKKEAWATNPTLVAGSGNDTSFMTDGTNVIDINGNVVDVFRGYRYTAATGFADADGNQISLVQLKDGYVSDPSKRVTLNADQTDGQFDPVYVVDKTTGQLTNRMVINNVRDYDNNAMGPSYVWVWRNGGTSAPNGEDNVVTASHTSGGNLTENGEQKAVSITGTVGNFTSRERSDTYLSSLGNYGTYFKVNTNANATPSTQYGVLLDGNNRPLLDNHTFNSSNQYLIRGKVATGTNYVTKNGQYFAVYNNNLVKANAAGQPVDNNGAATTDPSAMQVVAQLASRAAYIKKASGKLVNDDDFKLAATTDRVVAVMIRDMDLQAVPTQTEFFKVNNTTGQDTLTDTQNWAIAPVLHGVNANILLKPKTLAAGDAKSLTKFAGATANKVLLEAGEAIQLDIVAGTKGRDSAGTKTTGILLVDGGTKRYVGLRNINSVVKASGTLQVNSKGIALDLPNTKLAMRGELATGGLATAASAAQANGTGTGATATRSDRLLGVEALFVGDVSALVSGSANGFLANARIKMNSSQKQGMMVSLSDPAGKGRLLFDNISGTVDIKDLTVGTVFNAANKGAMNLKATVVINPEDKPAEDLRVGNISFNTNQADTNGLFDRSKDIQIGEMALTKHTIYTNTSIRGSN